MTTWKIFTSICWKVLSISKKGRGRKNTLFPNPARRRLSGKCRNEKVKEDFDSPIIFSSQEFSSTIFGVVPALDNTDPELQQRGFNFVTVDDTY